MLTGSSVSLAWLMTGAGEGDLKSPELVADIVEGMVGRFAPHISQVRNDEWLWKVHRGQTRVSGSLEKLCLRGSEFVGNSERRSWVSALREAPALMAALSTIAKGGGMPHVRQGGIAVDSVAVEGSKLDGTGLVKVHMGQIQLAMAVAGSTCDTWLGRRGLAEREPGDEEETCSLCTPCDKGGV